MDAIRAARRASLEAALLALLREAQEDHSFINRIAIEVTHEGHEVLIDISYSQGSIPIAGESL